MNRTAVIDSISFLIFILLSVALSHTVLAYDYRNRLFWTSAPGILLLFVIHPAALLFAITCFGLSAAVFLTIRHLHPSKPPAIWAYSVLLPLFAPDILNLYEEEPILFLGAAFFIIRQMMTVAQCLKQGVEIRVFFPALFIATFFLAAIPSGPVFSGLKIWHALRKNAVPKYGEGLYRLFEGFVFLFAIGGFTSRTLGNLERVKEPLQAAGFVLAYGISEYIVTPLFAFLFLFSTFYGYSRMAEGTAFLFGFEVPQNFNKPHLAKNLGDFWKRWHRSMADFVMQYIYLPLLVSTGRTKFALITAFVFMGMWHQISLNFLIWGFGHGIGLAIAFPWLKKWLPSAAIRVLSLLYIIFLSSIAHGVLGL